MHYRNLRIKRPPKFQVLRSAEDIGNIEFVDGLAEVEVPIDLVDDLPLKNHERLDSPRLRQLMHSVRTHGYSSLEPIIVRIGRAGRWVIVDGGHRITAAKLVAKEYLTNIFRRKVGRLSFLLFQTPLSYTRLNRLKNHSESARPVEVEPS